MASIHLTSSQQEILRIIPPNIKTDDLNEIKKLLKNYFAEKAMDEMDELWDVQGFESAKEMENWLDS